MLTIRPYISSDLDAVKALHEAQHLPYTFPDFEKPEFVVRAVLENGTGPEMALFLRKTAEAFLLFNPQISRRETIGRILAMTKECQAAAKRAGLTDVHAWIPPELQPHFGKLLVHLGWKHEAWSSYSRRID